MLEYDIGEVLRHFAGFAPLFGKKRKHDDESIGSKQTEDMPLVTEAVEVDEIEVLPPPRVPEKLKHFEVLSEIGKGGMGAVYLAHDISLDREVALKVLSPSLTRNEQMVERFVREARAQARINHPNITQIYFIGEEHNCHFFAMELVHGETLAEVLEEEGALHWEQALGYIQQSARGLAAAHERSVVHHDVKPSNLILTNEGVIKIADFGLAKQIERDSRITGTGVITGTPAYMSPEQGRGTQTDHRSDVYSLGASLFHLIAGRPPFEGDSPVGTIVQQITQAPPKLADIAPNVPKSVSELVERCLQKDPARRFQTYTELSKAIADAMPRKITPAGIYARFSAILFDLILISVVNALFLGALTKGIGNLTQVVFYAAYFVLLESLFGWTPGKRVLRLAVRKADGRRALPARLGLRFLLAHWVFFAAAGIFWLLGPEPTTYEEFTQAHPVTSMLLAILLLLYLLGLVAMVVGRRKSALHDSLAGTVVMYDIR